MISPLTINYAVKSFFWGGQWSLHIRARFVATVSPQSFRLKWLVHRQVPDSPDAEDGRELPTGKLRVCELENGHRNS